MENLYLLRSTTDIYILLTFRANDLSHSQKIDIIIDIEDHIKIKQDGDNKIHLVWSNGFIDSDLTIWSEQQSTQIIPYNDMSKFFIATKLETHPLPLDLKQKMNRTVSYMVFPDQDYVEAMLYT